MSTEAIILLSLAMFGLGLAVYHYLFGWKP